MAARREDAV